MWEASKLTFGLQESLDRRSSGLKILKIYHLSIKRLFFATRILISCRLKITKFWTSFFHWIKFDLKGTSSIEFGTLVDNECSGGGLRCIRNLSSAAFYSISKWEIWIINLSKSKVRVVFCLFLLLKLYSLLKAKYDKWI